MKCTEILKEEHEVIISHLNSLKFLITRKRFEDIYLEIPHYIDFVRIYSDKFHHAKEEDIYFKWIIKQNPALELGPIKQMLNEHVSFRELIDISSRALDKFKVSQDAELKKQCLESLNQFIYQLLAHIDKENNILYKIADSLDQKTKSGDLEMLPIFEEVQNDYKEIIKRFL